MIRLSTLQSGDHGLIPSSNPKTLGASSASLARKHAALSLRYDSNHFNSRLVYKQYTRMRSCA